MLYIELKYFLFITYTLFTVGEYNKAYYYLLFNYI
jgi:hypothetical protein